MSKRVSRKKDEASTFCCRVWPKLKCVLLGLVSLVVAFNPLALLGATYYIDFGNGSDANLGTSKTTSWKHCPAMQPFTGKYEPKSGDRFIFKGGVTWPNSALPLLITSGGNITNQTYYGVDLGWFAGTTWSRPIFDAQGKSFANYSGNRGNVVWIKGLSYLAFDNIEIMGFVWDDPVPTGLSDGFSVYVDSCSNVVVSKVYVHDWIVQTTSDGKFGGLGGAQNSNVIASNCLVVAPKVIASQYVTDTGGGTSSGCGVMGFNIVDGCEFVGTTQGIWAPSLARNNIVRNGQDSFNSATHENGAWIQNSAEFYNNVIHNTGEGVGVYFLPGWGGRGGQVMRIFNNVFYSTPQINLTSQANPDESNELWFFNNVVKQGSFCINIGTTKEGAAFGRLVVQNNVFISDSESSSEGVIRVLDSNDLGSKSAITNNVVYKTDSAAALGMTETNLWRPPLAILSLVDKGASFDGVPLSVNSGTAHWFDRTGAARPKGAGWDIGAYEYTDVVSSNILVAPSALIAKSVATNRIDLFWFDNASTETGFSIERSRFSSTGFEQIGAVGANVVAFTDADLAAESTYYYRVCATNSVSKSGYAGPVSASTRAVQTKGHSVGAMVDALTGAVSSTFSCDSESIFQRVLSDDLSGAQAVFQFDIQERGYYTVQVMADAPSESSNSLFVNVDSIPLNPQSVWHIPTALGFTPRSCSWQGNGTYLEPEFVPKVFLLSPGLHDLVIYGREANVRIKSIGLFKTTPPPSALRLTRS